jgi:AbrB family looped-hinge helix DNA binding protein
METVKVSSKGQIVIPKSLRESHRIHTGDSFIVTSVGDELRFKPAPAAGTSSLKTVAGMLRQTTKSKPSERQQALRIATRLRDEDQASKHR